MQVIAERRMSFLALVTVVLLAGAIVMTPIEYVPYLLFAAAGVALFVSFTAFGDLLTAVLLWFVVVICFDEEFWRAEIPFFFNVTISRLLIVALGMSWVGMWVVRRTRVRSAKPVLALMAGVLIFFTASAVISGFKTIAVASVHYRLIGGYWFAFAIFFFVLHGVRNERHILRLLMFFFIIGMYLAFTGWCEHLKLWSLVFPTYISDSTKGIHWGRVRGPFLVSATMGLALLFCYFNNLVLARQVRGIWRPAIYVVCILMLPVLFWTQTRSVWLGIILGSIVWFAYTRRSWSRAIPVCLLTAAAILVFTINAENIFSSQRTKGGITDMEPVYMRVGLALITWDIFTDYPVAGVGFGHFRDAAPRYARNVDSPYYAFASSAMEHNNFLSLLAETGLAGLAAYLALLLALLRGSIQLYRRLPASAPGPINRDIVVLYWVLFAMYIVDSMFRETSVHPFTNCLFFGISGVIAALAWLLRPQPLGLHAAGVVSPHSGRTLASAETSLQSGNVPPQVL